jgi:cytochrome o ubiquinol oxidase subunit 2
MSPLTYDKNGRETTIPVIPGRAAQQADARTKAFVRAICVPDGVKTPFPPPLPS